MSKHEHTIEKICKFAFVFCNIDTVYIDETSNLKLEFGFNLTPEPLKAHFGNMYSTLKLNEISCEHDVLFHSNSYKINFISARICKDTGYLGSVVVGPYLLEEPTDSVIQDIIHENNLSISLRHIIKQYYLSLPLVSTYKAKVIAEFLGYFISNLSSTYPQQPSVGDIEYTFQTEDADVSSTINKNADLSMDSLEERYYIENELMHAVANGDKEKVTKILNEDFFIMNKISDRIPNDPLRSRKNLTFVLNTLLRIAAKNGGLHPVYIHSISEKHAIQIEKASSIQQLKDLQKDIILSYCDAVKKFNLKNFSPHIRKAIEFIRVNLDQDLNLEIISDAIHASSFELSRQFKKETGTSITEYINKQRINESIYIMENNSISITDIAQMVGFNDVNYFTKVFKKIKGITPSEYRKTNK